VFEIPNDSPFFPPSQVRKSKKSRKTSKRLLKKVYTCIMILLTTQTKEKKMSKPYELTQHQWNKVQDRIASISKDQNNKWNRLNPPIGRPRKEVKVYPTTFLLILQDLLGGLVFDKETAYWILLNLENENLVVSTIQERENG